MFVSTFLNFISRIILIYFINSFNVNDSVVRYPNNRVFCQSHPLKQFVVSCLDCSCSVAGRAKSNLHGDLTPLYTCHFVILSSASRQLSAQDARVNDHNPSSALCSPSGQTHRHTAKERRHSSLLIEHHLMIYQGLYKLFIRYSFHLKPLCAFCPKSRETVALADGNAAAGGRGGGEGARGERRV